jgi:hypothetical protein
LEITSCTQFLYVQLSDRDHHLRIVVREVSVSQIMVRSRKPPSQTWRTFLENHLTQMVSIDFFSVPTIRFHVLCVFGP